ncbi:MAG: hypothetical protein M3Y81_01085 [Chloroflexota bacterium]|nr:hypothetical protein [Chloroflexota bacterium]
MKEDNVTVMFGVGPDLLIPPHVVPILMELLAGERQQALSQREHLLAHLATCHYCRTAVVFLLGTAQEYDHRNNDSEGPAHDLLVSFANISSAIEAREYERLGTYAETIVSEGRDTAALHFPDVAFHLRTCPDCCSVLEAIVTSITASEETD